MEEPLSPFEFQQCANILESTGKKARSLRELREMISVIREGLSLSTLPVLLERRHSPIYE
jgi:hypothetical protein